MKPRPVGQHRAVATAVHQGWCTDHAGFEDGSADWCESRTFSNGDTGAFVLVA